MKAPWISSYGDLPFNLTYSDKTISGAVLETAAREGGFPALSFMGKSISYSSLAANIETTAKSFHALGTRPGDIVAGFAPSICPRCYEIGEDVASEFRKVFPKEVIPGLLTPKGGGKYLLNLWAANTHTLTSCGVLPQNIHQTNVCTLCNPDLLFSHRAHGTERGNNMSFIRILT